jgi:hypothetical protein
MTFDFFIIQQQSSGYLAIHRWWKRICRNGNYLAVALNYSLF